MSEIWYTARNSFASTYPDESHWQDYVKWSRLTHITALILPDSNLNSLSFQPDYDSVEDWKYIDCDKYFITGLYNSPDYVLEKTSNCVVFNYLAHHSTTQSVISSYYGDTGSLDENNSMAQDWTDTTLPWLARLWISL